MCGYRVPRKAGWDCHGLPVELEVEKELGISSKQEIEEYGIAEFNARCRESVFEYVEEWNRLTERIGFWIDLDDPYVTLEDDYIESVWWSLRSSGTTAGSTRATRSCPTARATARRSPRTRSRRATRTSRTPRSTCASRCSTTPARGRRVAARLDDDALDAARQRRRRGRSRRHLRAGRGRRRDADRRRAAGREGARRGRRDRRRLPGTDLVGRRYDGPGLRSRATGSPGGFPGDRRRLRHHRGRHRPRPHRPGLRRGRLRGRRRERALRPDAAGHPLQPGQARRPASTTGSSASRIASSRTRR